MRGILLRSMPVIRIQQRHHVGRFKVILDDIGINSSQSQQAPAPYLWVAPSILRSLLPQRWSNLPVRSCSPSQSAHSLSLRKPRSGPDHQGQCRPHCSDGITHMSMSPHLRAAVLLLNCTTGLQTYTVSCLGISTRTACS